jgi:hypothetical protein
LVIGRRLTGIALAAIAFMLASPMIGDHQAAEAHPLHTSLAELRFDSRNGTVALSLRVFVDDFTAASNEWRRRSGVATGSSALIGYSLATFLLKDASGKRVVLTSCGGKRVGDLMWLCFRGRVSPQLKGSTVSSNILFDKYSDQINIVQATYEGRRANLLFTPGAGPKKIP